ncbi:hypothetical protein E1264_19260 [Actinomadura sp. KC216]|uniref:hypothetical protein n=1 Tax=Actinomadura sp. KC216 TaxID=2530370 RepID=UPI0010528C99|nr:hypothetical protein [Actinomadura sp. KC216]TDB86031.1 hypothetical protein E1264_19260 [Actinomadura sp. KC216]
MSAGNQGVLTNERVANLHVLRGAVEARRELACELIERRGVTWISVARFGGSGRLVLVGCDFVREAWWFTWQDGRPIAPVRDVEGVIAMLVRELA